MSRECHIPLSWESKETNILPCANKVLLSFIILWRSKGYFPSLRKFFHITYICCPIKIQRVYYPSLSKGDFFSNISYLIVITLHGYTVLTLYLHKHHISFCHKFSKVKIFYVRVCLDRVIYLGNIFFIGN